MTRRLRALMMPDYRAGNPYQGFLADALRDEGVDVVFPTGYRRGLPLLRAARDVGADVVHLHWLDPYVRPTASALEFLLRAGKTLLDLSLLRASGRQLVWTIHNEVSHESKHPLLERLVMRLVERLAVRTIVHEPSRRAAHAHAEVVPVGSYAQKYLPRVDSTTARAALALATRGRVFLHFGLLRPYKGVEDLLASWHASGLGREHQLFIAGPAPDPHFRAELVSRAGPLEGVRLLAEFIPDERVHLLFSAADVVVLPFRRVATSSSLILALDFKVPVLIPRLPTLVDVAGATGPAIFFEPDDPESLRRALEDAAAADLAGLRARFDGVKIPEWSDVARATAHLLRVAAAREA